MRIKVELHSRIPIYLRQFCNDRENEEFYRCVEAIRTEPIRNSEMILDPETAPYMARYFRFGSHIAVFVYDPARNQIWITQCRRARLQGNPRRKRDDQP